MDEKEFIENFGMTREEYAKKYGVLEDPNLGKDKTLRQKSVDKVAGALQNLGFDQYLAYNQANRLLGNYENPITEGGIGVLDFTPLQIPFAIQEAKRAFDRGDYVESGVTGGFSALETLPFMKLVSAPVKSFFKSLGNKVTSETPIDLSRRKAFAPIVATPIAVGALSEIPVGKIMEDVMPAPETPVVKPVAAKAANILEEMDYDSFDFEESPQDYVKIMREIFSEKTGLPPSKYDDNLMGERLMQNEMYHQEGESKKYFSLADYARAKLPKEEADKFLKNNKIDLDFHKTEEIDGSKASDELREKIGKKYGYSKLYDGFGDFNVEDSLDTDYSDLPMTKDEMVMISKGGDPEGDWEDWIKVNGAKTERYNELKEIKNKIDKLSAKYN
jgi:hypothetical protein